MRTNKVAVVYAESLLTLGQEQDSLELFREEFSEVQRVFAEFPKLTDIYSSPQMNKKEKLSLVEKVFKGRINKNVLNFLKILIQKDRTSILDEIIYEYNGLLDKLQNKIHVYVKTAVPLEKAAISQLEKSLSSSSGMSPVIHNEVNSSILGGLIIQINDTVADKSVARELELLREKIITSNLRSEEIYEN